MITINKNIQDIKGVSIIVSTYNWKEALYLSVMSILNQTILPNEIIIADDGSREDTKFCIDKLRSLSKIPIIHVWHEDSGFQLAAIRNKAILQANNEYIIQIDGDIILSSTFVQDHLELAQKNSFITGSRVILTKETTELLLINKSIEIRKYSQKRNNNFFNGIKNRTMMHLFADIYKQYGKYKYYVKGCNMSFWLEDLFKVNGYNENFTGWGREDSEIAIRLINAGIKKRFLKMGGVCYHLWHPEAPRHLEKRNVKLMEDAIKQKKILADKGLLELKNNYT